MLVKVRIIMILKYTNSNCNYSTVRQVLKQEFRISSNLLTTLRKNNSVFLNNSPIYLDAIISKNDVICVNIDFDEECDNIVATNIPLDILFEDSYMLIINKPAGMPVHPSMSHYEDSLSNGVKYYFNNIGLKRKIRPVNRLDRNTSGIVIFAKNAYIHDRLSNLMQNHLFRKEYIAICDGFFREKSGTINAPIARKENSIIERCVSSSGSPSVTHYDVIKKFSVKGHPMSKVHIVLETGRTHQIRVHLAYIGHPIVGDSLYSSESEFIDRQALHAYKVEFVHPISGDLLCITSECKWRKYFGMLI